MNLSDRVAIVTGASSGIGRGLAIEAGLRGMRVVIADRDEAGLAVTKSLLRERAVEAVSYCVDVSDCAAMEEFSSDVYRRFGEVYILFNNAGVHVNGPSWRHGDETWKRLLGANLFGVINGMRAFLPKMIDSRKEGVIANTASLAGLISFPYSGAYCASKHAVIGLTESVHFELTEAQASVRMALICPGAVATGIAAPSGLKANSRTRDEDLDIFDKRARSFNDEFIFTIQDGMSSQEHAKLVFDELEAGSFWIISDERYIPMIEERLNSIKIKRHPKFETF